MCKQRRDSLRTGVRGPAVLSCNSNPFPDAPAQRAAAHRVRGRQAAPRGDPEGLHRSVRARKVADQLVNARVDRKEDKLGDLRRRMRRGVCLVERVIVRVRVRLCAYACACACAGAGAVVCSCFRARARVCVCVCVYNVRVCVCACVRVHVRVCGGGVVCKVQAVHLATAPGVGGSENRDGLGSVCAPATRCQGRGACRRWASGPCCASARWRWAPGGRQSA